MECSDYIAIIALAVSIITFYFQFFPNRKNLKCAKAYLWRSIDYYCLTVTLENHSRLPLSIVSVKMILKDKTYNFYNEKCFLYGGSYPTFEGTEKISVFSDEFPISLDFLSSNTFRILFDTDDNITEDTINIELDTTRGTINCKNIKVINKQY